METPQVKKQMPFTKEMYNQMLDMKLAGGGMMQGNMVDRLKMAKEKAMGGKK